MPVAASSAFHYYRGMDEAISAAEANRAFSRLLREVRGIRGHAQKLAFIESLPGLRAAPVLAGSVVLPFAGRSEGVTLSGVKLVPCGSAAAGREAARTSLLARLARQPAQDVGRWTRDELYER